MEIDKLEKVVGNITLKMIDFEEGDLILISEMSDSLNELSGLLIKVTWLKPVLDILMAVMDSLLRGDNLPGTDNLLTGGIDLITKAVAALKDKGKLLKEPDELLANDITRYCEDYAQLDTHPGREHKSQKGKSKTHQGKGNADISIKSESFKIFLAEAEEKIILAQDCILKLEKEPTNKEVVTQLFRIFHTIKGECGFLRLASLGELAHHLENLLEYIRSKEALVTTDVVELLLVGIDYIKEMLEALKIGQITIFNQISMDEYITRINEITQKQRTALGELLKTTGKLSDEDVLKILQKQKESAFTKKFGEIAIEENLLSEEDITEMLNAQKVQQPTAKKTEKLDPIIKVKASQVNYLVDMIGELMIAQNQLDERDRNVTQLKKITKQIQYAAMQLRTVKISNLFINMKRLARDTAKKLNKAINTETSGEDLEIDRNLVELLEEPLIHLVRNAIYHGIENAEERRLKNKSEAGNIMLRAERRGNHVVISVRDDGGGLNEERIARLALEKGLVTQEQLSGLSKNQICDFIFLPGFSTALEVDNVSGRGMGMDIVRASVQSARGKTEIKTEKDDFTEISLVFPLSMAIIDGMIVKVQDMFFVMPINNVVENIQLNNEQLFSIEHKAKVIDLREEIIPVVVLKDFFNLPTVYESERKVATIVVAQDKKFAFIVDGILGKKEVVIKPLGTRFAELKGISAGTILQGGKIGYIIDIEEIVTTSSNVTDMPLVSNK